jgi:hypothetical protein
MAHRLPPDLARLGDELTAAAERRVADRARATRHRWLALAGVSGALAFAALTPAGLAPSVRDLGALAAATPVAQCKQPASEKFMKACEPVMVLYRPYAVR